MNDHLESSSLKPRSRGLQGDAASRDGGGQHHVLPGVQANERHRPLSASPPSCRLALCLRVLLPCAVMTAVGVLFITGGIVVSPQLLAVEICETVALTFVWCCPGHEQLPRAARGRPAHAGKPEPRPAPKLASSLSIDSVCAWQAPRGFAQRSSTAARSELGANLLTGGDSRSAAVGDWDIETVGGRETPRLAGGL